MDEFLGKLKDGASKAKDSAEKIAKEVAKRTTNAIAHTKLSYAVNAANGKINDLYGEIGKTLYLKYLNGTEFDESLRDSFEQIDKLNEEIAALNAQIAELKNSVKCAECGAYNESEAQYCSKCGAHIEVAEDEADEDIDISFEDDGADDEEIITIDPKKPE